MALVQKQFNAFYDKIRLVDSDEGAQLRQKRKVLLDALAEGLRRQSDEHGLPALSYRSVNQGSYALGTGIVPKDGNYDIDVGLLFDHETTEFDQPVTLKKRVRDALASGPRSVRIRRPCVTVEYKRAGTVEYHVDLAVYANGADGMQRLAIGREHSANDEQDWLDSDPLGFLDAVRQKYTAKVEDHRFRRAIRFMKKWRNHCFPEGKPPSVAATLLAYHHFGQVGREVEEFDIQALSAMVARILGTGQRISAPLPVRPYTDVLATMTDNQADAFRAKLVALKETLDEAIDHE